MKIIDCVCSKLCHFHSRGGFPEGSLVCNAHFLAHSWSCRNKPLLFISLPTSLPAPPHKPMYISQNPHIRTHKSFWHLLCYAFFFLKVVENWDLPQSRKAGNHEEYLGKNAIWREKKKNEEEYKQITITLSNYFSNDN